MKTRTAKQCYDEFAMHGQSKATSEKNHRWTQEEIRLIQTKKKYESWSEFRDRNFPGVSLSKLNN